MILIIHDQYMIYINHAMFPPLGPLISFLIASWVATLGWKGGREAGKGQWFHIIMATCVVYDDVFKYSNN